MEQMIDLCTLHNVLSPFHGPEVTGAHYLFTHSKNNVESIFVAEDKVSKKTTDMPFLWGKKIEYETFFQN